MRRLDFWKSDWFLGIIVALLVLIVANGDLVQTLERKAYDFGVLVTSRAPPDRIAAVRIDDQSIANIGRWTGEGIAKLTAVVMLLAVGYTVFITRVLRVVERGRDESDLDSAQYPCVSRIADPKQDRIDTPLRMSPKLPACGAAVVCRMPAQDPNQRYPSGKVRARALRLRPASVASRAKPPASTNA
ncbi:MAG: hypothetical protein OEZ08_19375 [Betaproteobacteria bacterium]|nr:hypothetical protein [Betaproteobacteria bacterium]